MMARRTGRLWTDEEKRSICLQTAAPGVSVAQVALRYAVNANAIFKWLRDLKNRPGTGFEQPSLRFLPVDVVKEAPVTRPVPAAENHNKIDLAGGKARALATMVAALAKAKEAGIEGATLQGALAVIDWADE